MADIKELKAQVTRDLIIDTAEKLFSKNGYEKTIMDDIAKVAGLSKSTVYVYFKSKEEIYNNIILRGMKILQDINIKAVKTNKSFKERYFDLCFLLSDFQENDTLHFNAVTKNINIDFDENDTENILYKIYTVGEENNSILVKFIDNGKKEKSFRSDIDPVQTIFLLWSSLVGIIAMASEKEEYITRQLKVAKQEFLKNGFTMLYYAIKGENIND